MAWRLARSLEKLRDQINARWPDRAKHSDGTIGDTAHAARASDHNPNAAGVVQAIDITHDPAGGPDTWALADAMRRNKDRRVKYIISNGRIAAGDDGPSPWVWREYTGTNKHSKHVHISVEDSPALYDDVAIWKIASGLADPPPAEVRPKGITAEMRVRMARAMLGYEGQIPPKVVITTGGAEIAGVTEKNHPAKYRYFKSLLDVGATDKLVDEIIAFYLEYTAPAADWTDRAGPEFFLRDCILNRGPTGAAHILQRAVRTDIDGEVGPTTRGALAALAPDRAIDELRAAREVYEDLKYGKQARIAAAQWQGLVNRWNKAATQAKAFQREQGYTAVWSPEGAAAGGVVIVGTGTAVAVKGADWSAAEIGMAAVIIGVIALAAFIVVRKIRRRP